MFRRGFKTWCEKTSIDIRERLGLMDSDPIDPWAIASISGVKVWSPRDVPGLSEKDLNLLLGKCRDSWSAVTIHDGAQYLVIINSSHSKARQASDLAHELAHILLKHQPAQVAVTHDGLLLLNTYDKNLEEEAAWLAGCLLLPREALLKIKFSRLSLKEAAKNYRISQDLLTWRLNVTGVNSQFERARRGSSR